MKKTLVLVLLFLVVGSMYAFEARTKGIGGNISFNSAKDSISSFYISPKVSYFFVDNICLDVSFGYDIAWRKSGSYGTYEDYNIGIGGRYFLKRFYGGLGFLYHAFKNRDTESKYQEMELKLSAGYLIGIAKNVYLDVGIAYIKGLGDLKAQAPHYERHFGTTEISYKNRTSELRSTIGISVFFK